MFLDRKKDHIDHLIETRLYADGLIDWDWIDRELAARGCTMDRPILHKRMKRIIRETWPKSRTVGKVI
jgi:hypothetical protein